MKRRMIRITYETVTPESAEQGDYADSGWIDEEGTPYTVDEAIRFLSGRYVEPSSSYFHADVWYTDAEPSHDRAYFEQGEETRQSYHLVGFTPREQAWIYAAIAR